MLNKKLLAAVFLLLFLLPQVTFAREYIADEEADKNQIGYGNVKVEREVESILAPVNLIAVPTIFAGTMVSSTAKKVPLYGTAATGGALSTVYSDTSAHWMNWPAGRFVFSTADPSKESGIINKMFGSIPISIISLIANKIFEITKTLTMVGINITVLAFNTNWATSISGVISDITGKMVDFENSGPFKLFFLFSICALTLAISYNFFKAQITQAFTALLVSALVVTAIIGWVANCDRLILGTTQMADELAGSSMAMLTNAFPFDDGTSSGADDSMNKGLRAAGNSAWRVSVVYPWSLTMFGTVDPNTLALTDKEIDNINRELEKKDEITGTPTPYLDTVYLAAASDDEARTAICNTIADKDVDHGSHDNASALMFSSTSNASRFLTTSLMSLFPALAYFVLSVVIGCSMIFCQFALMMMLIFTPFVLLVAMFPGAGWNFALGYFKKMLGLFAIKIFYGIYLGTVLFLGTAVSSGSQDLANYQLGTVMFFLTVIFAGAVIFRKKVFEIATSVSVNMQNKTTNNTGGTNVISELRKARRWSTAFDAASSYLSQGKNRKATLPPTDNRNERSTRQQSSNKPPSPTDKDKKNTNQPSGTASGASNGRDERSTRQQSSNKPPSPASKDEKNTNQPKNQPPSDAASKRE